MSPLSGSLHTQRIRDIEEGIQETNVSGCLVDENLHIEIHQRVSDFIKEGRPLRGWLGFVVEGFCGSGSVTTPHLPKIPHLPE